MKIFLLIYFLFLIINCQNENNEILSSTKEIGENDLNSEYHKCINQYGITGINKDLKEKEKETKDEGIKNILNSFRKKIETKEDEDIIKECKRKTLMKMKSL